MRLNLQANNLNKFETAYKNKPEFRNLELTLSRIDDALNEYGFPPSDLGRIIHIAGTNGKGSTSYFISQILESKGFKTALFTSPHIIKINERINYNNHDIDDNEFDTVFTKCEKIIDKHGLSYFEAVFMVACVWFTTKKPDITILETGLGGRFDATNTSLISDKLCVITAMSQDHADILGHNIYKICDEKLGILRSFSTLILGINKPFITKYIEEKINNNIIEVKSNDFAIDNYPFPYSENYSTAKTAVEYILSNKIEDMSGLNLPMCRLEKFMGLMLDGSHNPAGLLALTKSHKINKNQVIIISGTNDRDIKKTYAILSMVNDNIIVTSIPNNPRSITKNDADSIGWLFYEDPMDALKKAREYNLEIFVTGSFYLCAYIKKLLTAGH